MMNKTVGWKMLALICATVFLSGAAITGALTQTIFKHTFSWTYSAPVSYSVSLNGTPIANNTSSATVTVGPNDAAVANFAITNTGQAVITVTATTGLVTGCVPSWNATSLTLGVGATGTLTFTLNAFSASGTCDVTFSGA